VYSVSRKHVKAHCMYFSMLSYTNHNKYMTCATEYTTFYNKFIILVLDLYSFILIAN